MPIFPRTRKGSSLSIQPGVQPRYPQNRKLRTVILRQQYPSLLNPRDVNNMRFQEKENNGGYYFTCFDEQNNQLGEAYVRLISNRMWHLEHIKIFKEYRSNGRGTIFLQHICQELKRKQDFSIRTHPGAAGFELEKVVQESSVDNLTEEELIEKFKKEKDDPDSDFFSKNTCESDSEGIKKWYLMNGFKASDDPEIKYLYY
jgi:hypothetical protein